jgi:hypothetical protein
MKQIIKFIFIVWTLMISLPSTIHADTMQPPPNISSAELNRIKSLEGRWKGTTSMFGTPNEKIYVEYEVTSGGSAVLERIFPGTSKEMISVYYDDNHGKLAMTHYCIMRNRPTLKLASSTKDTITMDVAKVDGLKSKDDPGMGAVSIYFKDIDHIASTCEGRGKGKKKEQPVTIEYTRVK